MRSSASRSLLRQITAFAYLAPYLSANVAIAVWAVARSGADQISRRSALAAVWTDLALQLRFLFKMCLLGGGLMSAAPERPSDDVSGLDTLLRQPDRDAPDFLDRPADQ